MGVITTQILFEHRTIYNVWSFLRFVIFIYILVYVVCICALLIYLIKTSGTLHRRENERKRERMKKEPTSSLPLYQTLISSINPRNLCFLSWFCISRIHEPVLSWPQWSTQASFSTKCDLRDTEVKCGVCRPLVSQFIFIFFRAG